MLLRRLLDALKVPYKSCDSFSQLRKKLREYINLLWKGKKIQRRQEEQNAANVRFHEELRNIQLSWAQIVPQCLKDKIINLFRERTLSEALATFTCASCSEAVLQRSHCSLSLAEFDVDILKRPELRASEEHLDRYKWLHPDCTPPMPYAEGPLRDILVDPDGVAFPSTGGPPVLSLCLLCHSSSKKKKLPPLSLPDKPSLVRFLRNSRISLLLRRQ